MQIREANIEDFPRLMEIRLAVKENRLSDPSLVPFEAYVEYITQRGKGWVSLEGETITGFAVADLEDHNVWALFVDPPFEGRGAARALQQTMLEWYFGQTGHTLWLGTAPDSRAASFYRKSGWTEIGLRKNGEIRFEMTKADWERIFSS